MNALYFENALKAEGIKDSTIEGNLRSLKLFYSYLTEEGLTDIRDVTTHTILGFSLSLRTRDVLCNGKTQQGYASGTCSRILSSIHKYFSYLLRDGKILCSPFDGLDLSQRIVRHTRHAVDSATIVRFLESIDMQDALSLRDRAICELLYASAIRNSELRSLRMEDVDIHDKLLYLSATKNGESRIVPMSERSQFHLLEYVKHGRPQLAHRRSVHFFLSARGDQFGRNGVNKMLHRRLVDANMEDVPLTPHIFRHSCATHLLHSGAGIRHVQELLGHKSIKSTVVYTHFDIPGKRRMMKQYHPLENELFEEDILKN
jgi:site-specific recombinase XerD